MKNYQIVIAFLILIIISCNSGNSNKEEKKEAPQEKTLLDFINEAPNAKDFFSLVKDSSNLISLKELKTFPEFIPKSEHCKIARSSQGDLIFLYLPEKIVNNEKLSLIYVLNKDASLLDSVVLTLSDFPNSTSGFRYTLIEGKTIEFYDRTYTFDGKKKRFIEESKPIEAEKPLIYAYSESRTDISFKLKSKDKILFSYPQLKNNSWQATLIPNEGFLIDGKMYPYLFWDGLHKSEFSGKIKESGFVLEGKNILAFLEEKLTEIGLNRREITDFITYWGPRMQGNSYNFIHFLGTDEYAAEIAELEISPKPDNLFRLYMYFSPLEAPIKVKEQLLPKLKSRKGLTVVEWGGSELSIMDL
jgi:hypothetical protein